MGDHRIRRDLETLFAPSSSVYFPSERNFFRALGEQSKWEHQTSARPFQYDQPPLGQCPAAELSVFFLQEFPNYLSRRASNLIYTNLKFVRVVRNKQIYLAKRKTIEDDYRVRLG
jgi:hypothetical protein